MPKDDVVVTLHAAVLCSVSTDGADSVDDILHRITSALVAAVPRADKRSMPVIVPLAGGQLSLFRRPGESHLSWFRHQCPPGSRGVVLSILSDKEWSASVKVVDGVAGAGSAAVADADEPCGAVTPCHVPCDSADLDDLHRSSAEFVAAAARAVQVLKAGGGILVHCLHVSRPLAL